MSKLKLAVDKLKPGGHGRRGSGSGDSPSSPRSATSSSLAGAGAGKQSGASTPTRSLSNDTKPSTSSSTTGAHESHSASLQEALSDPSLSKNARKRIIKEHEKDERTHQRQVEREQRDGASTNGTAAAAHRDASAAAPLHRDPYAVTDKFGDAPLAADDDSEEDAVPRMRVREVSTEHLGKTVLVRARTQHIRVISPKLCFFVLRDQIDSLEAVLQYDPDAGKTEAMLRWAAHLPDETIVDVVGELRAPQSKDGEVKSATVHDVELAVDSMFIVGHVTAHHLPFRVENAARPIAEVEKSDKHLPTVSFATEFQNRAFDLRVPENIAIFRVRSGMMRFFRAFLDARDFVEINSPKLQQSATESGSSVFKVDYFGREAFLAQSPQLAKQMSIIGDMRAVYEVGPVFRAENSNTHRHLTEFTGMDVEMAIDKSYHECMRVLDGVLKHIFNGLLTKHRRDLDTIKLKFPHDDLVFPEETVVLQYSEGVKLLREAGWKKSDGQEVQDDEDLDTPSERRLGQIVKDKYKTDYYILDKFPLGVRPFYTMPDAKDRRFSNSFDIFIRGEEILSGGQRIHDPVMLGESMREAGIDPEDMGEYWQAFTYGAPPHAGGGFGLDRLVFLFLDLHNVRYGNMFPRDPRSFADAPRFGERKVKQVKKPEFGPNGELPALEDMIAAYGDSTSTAYVDPKYEIWRHAPTGAAIGFVAPPGGHGHMVVWGPPLCAPEERAQVVDAFIKWCQSKKYGPVWACVDEETEKLLSGPHNWRALTCIAESRLDPYEVAHNIDPSIEKKMRSAERAGVKIRQVEGQIDDRHKEEIDERIRDWQKQRDGAQIHTTEIRPWVDPAHRRYFYAEVDGKVCGLLVLTRLAPAHGWQVKWNLMFPNAPNGTTEFLVIEVVKILAGEGEKSMTFGASATDTISAAAHLDGAAFKLLSKTYQGIARTFRLTNKTHWRRKFHVNEEPLYVCYPKHGLGFQGVEAILRSVTDGTSRSQSRDFLEKHRAQIKDGEAASAAGSTGVANSRSGSVTPASSHASGDHSGTVASETTAPVGDPRVHVVGQPPKRTTT